MGSWLLPQAKQQGNSLKNQVPQPGRHRLLQVLLVHQPHNEDSLSQADHQQSHAHDKVDTCAPQEGGGRETYKRWEGLLLASLATQSSSPEAGLTNEGSANGGGWQCVGHNDQEDRVAQKECDLEGDPLTTFWGQVKAHDVHDHEEDTGQQQVDRIE